MIGVISATSGAPAAVEQRDPIYRLARVLLYLGMFASSLLVVRVDSLTYGDLLILTALALAWLGRAMNPRVAWPPSPYRLEQTLVLLLLVIVSALLAGMAAVRPAESLAVLPRLIVVAFLLPWGARLLLPSARELAAAAAWLMAGAAASASGTVLQAVVDPTLIPGSQVGVDGRLSGFTGHVSDLGGVAAMGVAIGFGFVLQRHRARLVSLLCLATLAVGLVLSGSVSGMLAVVVALIIYLVRGAIKFWQLAVTVIGGMALMTLTSTIQSSLLALDPWERLMRTLGISDGGRYSTSESRIQTYDSAVRGIVDSPFMGHGFDAISALPDGRFPAHNLFIGAAYEGGLLLAIAIAILALRPFAGRWLRRDQSILTTQLLAAVCAATVFAMTAPSLFNRYFWFPIALLSVARVLATATDGAALRSAASPSFPRRG